MLTRIQMPQQKIRNFGVFAGPRAQDKIDYSPLNEGWYQTCSGSYRCNKPDCSCLLFVGLEITSDTRNSFATIDARRADAIFFWQQSSALLAAHTLGFKIDAQRLAFGKLFDPTGSLGKFSCDSHRIGDYRNDDFR